MTSIMIPRIARREVVYATGCSVQDLKDWTHKRAVKLDADELRVENYDGVGWRRFSTRDCVFLALVRRLIDFGVGLRPAAGLAKFALKRLDGIERYRNTPHGAIAALFAGA